MIHLIGMMMIGHHGLGVQNCPWSVYLRNSLGVIKSLFLLCSNQRPEKLEGNIVASSKEFLICFLPVKLFA